MADYPQVPPLPGCHCHECERARRRLGGVYDLPETKAERLLLSHLDPEQQASWQLYRRFEMKVGRTKYVLHGTSISNIVVERPNGERERWCVGPERVMPVADIVLSQMLMLRHDPKGMRKIANIDRLYS